MIHTGKKSISLSLDELSVLSVNFNKEAMGEGQQRVYTQSHTHVHSHTHDHTAITADASLTVELGHAHKSPKHRHTYKHAPLWRHFQSHRGKPHMWNLSKKNPNKNSRPKKVRSYMYCTLYCTLTACTIRCFSSKYFRCCSTFEEWGRTKGKFCISQQCPTAGLLACLAQLSDSVHLFELPTVGGQSVCCSKAGTRSANLFVTVCSSPIKGAFVEQMPKKDTFTIKNTTGLKNAGWFCLSA